MLTKPNLECQSRKLVDIKKENNNIGFNVESRCKLNKESFVWQIFICQCTWICGDENNTI
jgi:hypothetical protein